MKSPIRSRLLALSFALVAAFSSFATAGCGGGKDAVTPKAPAAITAEQIDADPVALLPGSPLAVSHVDARALYGASYGEALGRLSDRAVPSGEETGFLPSRDIDEVWSAAYSIEGVHGLSVVRGKLDEKKLDAAVEKRTTVRGSALVKSKYAERNVYTVANVGICVLTAKTALVGTEQSIRRALDRITDGRLQRSVPSWMLDVLATQGAVVAGAADFESQPLPPSIKQQLPVEWLRNVKTAKVVGRSENGLKVEGHLTFPSPEEARGAEAGLQKAATLAKVIALTGQVPRLEGLELKTDGSAVDVAFRVDEKGISTLLNGAQRWL